MVLRKFTKFGLLGQYTAADASVPKPSEKFTPLSLSMGASSVCHPLGPAITAFYGSPYLNPLPAFETMIISLVRAETAAGEVAFSQQQTARSAGFPVALDKRSIWAIKRTPETFQVVRFEGIHIGDLNRSNQVTLSQPDDGASVCLSA